MAVAVAEEEVGVEDEAVDVGGPVKERPYTMRLNLNPAHLFSTPPNLIQTPEWWWMTLPSQRRK